MPHILMLTHDQHIDRRIIAQASSLIKKGHRVTLIALSFNCNSHNEMLPEGIDLFRIPLSEIIPKNKSYDSYLKRQIRLNLFSKYLICQLRYSASVINSIFDHISRINWQMYRVSLFLHYQNVSIGDPLPFYSAFLNEGYKQPADLIQVHDLPALEAGVELAKEWQVPLVYDSHELYPEQKTFSLRQRKICHSAEKRLIQKANLILTVNQSIAEEISRRYGVPRPIVLINALDPPNFFDPKNKNDLIRNNLKLKKERRILLYQGGFSPHRNLKELVFAFSKIRTNNVDLVMMGFGDYGSLLRNEAERLGLLNRRIFFLPPVSQSDLIRYTASADIGIIPYPHVDINSYYCTPNKLFEYIQATLPILANDSPELRRFVSKQGFGINFPMDNSNKIALAVDFAFSSIDYLKWKENLLNRRKFFSWSFHEKIYLSAIQQLLNKSKNL